MNAPFRYAHTPVTGGAHEASFHAKAAKLELSMGVTFGRALCGYTGMGTIEVVPAGVRIVARRYRYWSHAASAIAAGALGIVFFYVLIASAQTRADPSDGYKVAAFWFVVFGILGAWIASASVRFTAPVTEVVERSCIQHVQMIGPRLRIFASGGDIELWIPKPEALRATLQALAAMGIPMR